MTGRRRVIVVFGGRSAEHEVSCVSARHVIAAMDPERHELVPVGIDRSGRWWAADVVRDAFEAGTELGPALEAAGRPTTPSVQLAFDADDEAGPPVVFPVLHGPYGEDGRIQGLFEMAGVPYVGSGVLSSALCMDKLKCKEVLAYAGIDQAAWRGVQRRDRSPALAGALAEQLGLPLFVKPANMGSSIGVSRATSVAGLVDALDLAAAYDEWIVVEEQVVGREIECAVLGNDEPRASLPGEIVPGAEFYDYADKYDDGADIIVPAALESSWADVIRTRAVEAYRALRCSGLCRVDFFLDEAAGRVLVNELNTMPGFTPISMYPKMWAASGLSYEELVDQLLDLAVQRWHAVAEHARSER